MMPFIVGDRVEVCTWQRDGDNWKPEYSAIWITEITSAFIVGTLGRTLDLAIDPLLAFPLCKRTEVRLLERGIS